MTPENLKKMEAEGKKIDGLPYDTWFGWGDDRIYCSELIYKIYRNALAVEIGKTSRLEGVRSLPSRRKSADGSALPRRTSPWKNP